MLPTEKSNEKAPDTPPMKEPSVPEYDIGDVAVGVDVPTTFSVPLDPAV